MQLPTISVLMPVYNAERYVAQAVQSILDQTYRDFEFLIVDDGSTDRSLDILESLATKDDRIRLVSRPNTGYVVALNEMLELARGELIARMDADDIAIADRFEKQVELLMTEHRVVAVGSWLEVIDEDGDLVCVHRLPSKHPDIDEAMMRGAAGVIPHPASMMRLSAVRLVGAYRPSFEPAEDRDLFLRLGEIGLLANIELPLLRYRLSTRSQSTSRLEEARIATARALREAYSRRQLARELPTHEGKPSKTLTDFHCQWAWWALSDGNKRTAVKHAKLSVLKNPISIESWKVLLAAMRDCYLRRG